MMQFFILQNFTRKLSRGAELHPAALRALVLLIAVAYPYLCRIGGFPHIDEGSYAFFSLIYKFNLANDQPLAALQGLSLWPLLLCWIPDLPGMPLLWYRLADLAAALVAAWLFCAILQKECGVFSYLIAFIYLSCMTDYKMVESGFKHSFFPAWACFFGAILICWKNRRQWFWAGALTAFGVLLRETFFPFALLGFAAVWKIGGFKKAFVYFLGGVLCALLVAAFIEWRAPGSLQSILIGYLDRTLIYKIQAGGIWINIDAYLFKSIILFSPALLVSIVIIAWHFLFLRQKEIQEGKISNSALWFWLCAAFIPLYETVIKIGFPYHYAQALPGLACLTGLFGRHMQWPSHKTEWQKAVAGFLTFLGALALLLAFFNLPGPASLADTARAISSFQRYEWPAEMIDRSIPLELVAALRKELPNGGTVSTNALSMFIYPAGGFLPPLSGKIDPQDHYMLGDLSRFFIQTGQDKVTLKNALIANPPDMIALLRPLSNHEPAFPEELAEVIESTGLYEKTGEIRPLEIDTGRQHADWASYDLYKLKTHAKN